MQLNFFFFGAEREVNKRIRGIAVDRIQTFHF